MKIFYKRKENWNLTNIKQISSNIYIEDKTWNEAYCIITEKLDFINQLRKSSKIKNNTKYNEELNLQEAVIRYKLAQYILNRDCKK